jgi:hypothetical protein
MTNSLLMTAKTSLSLKRDRKNITICFRTEKKLKKRGSNKLILSSTTQRFTSEMVTHSTQRRSVRELKRGSNSDKIVMRSRKWPSRLKYSSFSSNHGKSISQSSLRFLMRKQKRFRGEVGGLEMHQFLQGCI